MKNDNILLNNLPNYETLNEVNEEQIKNEKKAGFTDDLPIIDQIFNKYGYGLITWKFIILTMLIICVDGIEMTLFTALIIPIKSYYALTETYTLITSSVLYLSVGLGSFSVGFLTKKIHRTLLLNITLFLLAIFHIFMAFSDTIILFIIFRFFVGYFTGVCIPIIVSLLTEHLPMKLRSTTLILVWIGFSIGQIGIYVVMLMVMPNLEKTQIKTVLLLISVIPITAFIINLILIEDSPRHLLILNKDDKAFDILESLNEGPLDEETRKIIKLQAHSGINEHLRTEFKDIFHSSMLRLTILLMIIWMLNSLMTYGDIDTYTKDS